MSTVAAEKRTAIANILYATDFSPAAVAALPYVRGIASKFESKVHVLHVRPPVSYSFVTPDMVPNVMEIQERLEAEQTDELDKFFGKIPHEIFFESGELPEEVESLIQSKLIDLIVIGTNGRTGAAKVLLGSVAAEILRRAPCPVLTVGPHCAGNTKTDLEMREILYASDFSPESIAAAPYAISLAQESQAEITLVHVIPPSNGAELVRPEQYFDSSWRRLRNLVPPETELWCRPTCIVTTGQPAEAILKLGWDRRPDMVVLGAKNVERSMSVATHLSRSTAQAVIANAPCPVLTVRAPQHLGEEQFL